MAAPLRGTQSLVGQMGWVFDRPSLTALEVAWRWVFGIPFLTLSWMLTLSILSNLSKMEMLSPDLTLIDTQNPWVAAQQLARLGSITQPHVIETALWFLPLAALVWVIVSGVGRGLLLKHMVPSVHFRPAAMIVLQAAWLALFAATYWGWLRSMEWAAATHIAIAGEPDLIGYSMWVIFLSLGFFTAWALLSWPFAIAPVLMLLEDCGPTQALARSLQLGKPFASKLVEINLVMGIVKLALFVVAMVLSAAPLPFSDQLGADTLHWITAAAAIFYFVGSDYFQVVRLKGFVEFWKMFRGGELAS